MRATRQGLPLVDREIQVLALVARGNSYAEIASTLHLAHASVRNYGSSAIKKLGARSQAHAVHLAWEAGILRRERHGDHAGFVAHTRRGEPPCDGCVQGELDYQAERRAIRRQTTARSTPRSYRDPRHAPCALAEHNPPPPPPR